MPIKFTIAILTVSVVDVDDLFPLFYFHGFWKLYTVSFSLCQCSVCVGLCVRKNNVIPNDFVDISETKLE